MSDEKCQIDYGTDGGTAITIMHQGQMFVVPHPFAQAFLDCICRETQPIQRRIKYYRGHSVMPFNDGDGTGYQQPGTGYFAKIWHGYPQQRHVASGATPDEALEAAVQEVLKVRGEV